VPVFLRATRGAERDTHANLESILGHGNHRRRKGPRGRLRQSPSSTGPVGARAANVLPIIREAQKAGATTVRQIAEALNARGVATARGGQWYATSVSNVLSRA
jgi:hypothetical protein